MSSAETNHVTTPAAPTATIEEEDFQYFDEVESVCRSVSEERMPMTANMTAGLEVPTLVRVATCGSTISHIKQDPRSVTPPIYLHLVQDIVWLNIQSR